MNKAHFKIKKLERVFSESYKTVTFGALASAIVILIILMQSNFNNETALIWFSLVVSISSYRLYFFKKDYSLLKSRDNDKIDRLEFKYYLTNISVGISWSFIFGFGIATVEDEYAILIMAIAVGWTTASITSLAMSYSYYLSMNFFIITSTLIGIIFSNIVEKELTFTIASISFLYALFSAYRYKNMFLDQEQKKYENNDIKNEIVRALGRAGEYRDEETGYHISRMSYGCYLLAKNIGFDEEKCQMIKNASALHDVGKIGIPDSILLKPGKLTEQEYEIMKTHTTIGRNIIGDSDNELSKMARSISSYHHERWDGNGYPEGLSGEEIPIEARIASVSDVFDALTSERPYKKAWKKEEAINFLIENSGKNFEPKLVEKFIEIIPELSIYSTNLKHNTNI